MADENTARLPYALKSVGCVGLCVVGFWAFMQVVIDFAFLQPVALACVFNPTVLLVVQTLERLVYKPFTLVTLLFRKAFFLVAIILVRARGVLCRLDVSTEIDLWWAEIGNWDPLWEPWHSNYAGRSTPLRFIAVVLMLFALSLGFFWLTVSLDAEAEDLKDEIGGYTQELVKFLMYVRMDKWVRNRLHHPEDLETTLQTLGKKYLVNSLVVKLWPTVHNVVIFVVITLVLLFRPLWDNSGSLQDIEGGVAPLLEGHRLEDAPTMAALMDRVHQVLQSYFGLLVLFNSFIGIADLVVLKMMGVCGPVFCAMVAFLVSFIPAPVNIAMALPLPMIALQPGVDWNKRAWMLRLALGWILIKIVVGKCLTSIVMARNKNLAGTLNAHPVLMLAVVGLAAKAWGFVGMVISPPLLSIVRQALHMWYSGNEGAVEW